MKNILQKNTKLIVLITSILTATFAVALPDEIFSYIQNSEVRLGVITNYGAVIGYFSEISPANNFINYMDAGREIQQSYYGWADGSTWSGNPWRWNPVQGGSWQNDKPRLLVFSNENNRIYAKSNPRNWAGCELLTDVVMEEWISLSGNVAHIIFKMTYTGPSNGPVTHQELPAVFLDAEYNKLTFYNGPISWTEGSLTNFQPGGSNGDDNRYEEWAAYVNNAGWGMGVYTPGTVFQTRYWIAGSGNEGNGCSYFAPIQSFAITSNNFVYQYDVYITIGMTNEMRNTFDDVRKSKFKYDPMSPVKNPGFESPVIPPPATATNVINDWSNSGLIKGTFTEPLESQVAWFNGSPNFIYQSFPDVKLQPNTTYELVFDAYSVGAAQTIKAGIMLGKNNAPRLPIHSSNVENFEMSSGTWNGDDWAGGGQFNTLLNPSANNPESTHALVFETPVSNVVGNYISSDLTLNFWGTSGVQVRLDNVSATNYPRDRTNLMPVQNGGFDSDYSGWNTSGIGGGIIDNGISPVSGNNAWFNSSTWIITQIFPGMKIKTNRTYRITFDSYSVGAEQPFKVALVHGRYQGDNSRYICPIDDANVTNLNVQDTTLASLGAGWLCGVTVTNVLNPVADAEEISHVFTFDTPATLSGDKLAFDLGIRFWDAGGVQIRLDNIAVTNFPTIPEGGLVFSFLCSVFGLIRRYSKRVKPQGGVSN